MTVLCWSLILMDPNFFWWTIFHSNKLQSEQNCCRTKFWTIRGNLNFEANGSELMLSKKWRMAFLLSDNLWILTGSSQQGNPALPFDTYVVYSNVLRHTKKPWPMFGYNHARIAFTSFWREVVSLIGSVYLAVFSKLSFLII